MAVAGVLLAVTAGLAGCGAAAAKAPGKAEGGTLNVALVPAENGAEQVKRYQKFFDYLEKKTGMKVKPYLASDYTGVVEAMRADHIDVAWYGPFSYILAAQEAGAEAFSIPVGDKSGKVYQSYIIARKDAKINTLADLKGHSFTFGDTASTSGHLIPRYMLTKAGIDPDKDMKTQFSGAHDATGLAVANGKVEAGGIWDAAYRRLVEKKLVDESQVQIIQKSDPIPEGPWAWRKNLDAGLKTKIKDALLAVSKEDPTVLDGTGYKEFTTVADSEYDMIRDTAKALKLDIKKLK